MHDFHYLCEKHGVEMMSTVIGRNERTIKEVRRGVLPLSSDDLFELERTFPQFDTLGTIRKIGKLRETRGLTRKIRRKE